MGDDLGCNNIQKHGERAFLLNYLHDEGKEILHDSYQTNETDMEIEEWKQKVLDNYVKIFSRVLLNVLETSIVS